MYSLQQITTYCLYSYILFCKLKFFSIYLQKTVCHILLILNYWCPLKVRNIVPMCPQYYQTNIVDTFSKSKPLNQKA